VKVAVGFTPASAWIVEQNDKNVVPKNIHYKTVDAVHRAWA
jgi:hypothetical protein